MRICVVIQSAAFRSSAGMRIRYQRFAESLAGTDASLEAVTTAELLAASAFDHDVYVFCKTFDTSALLLARRLSTAGKVIGHDIFDDYFSQQADPRLQKFRDWIRDMEPVTDFAVCSTERMVVVLQPYLPNTRITAIGDPILGFDSSIVGKRADSKVQRARETRTLNFVWFGIGDNPFFQVGLSDLAACEQQLSIAERLGWRIELRIVTNRRPFERARAEALRALGFRYQLVEWSEEAEREAIAEAAVALLPVSGQSFSRAKSLNRAITALSGGCQILSIGYPLYRQLEDFTYCSIERLVSDIDTGSCLVRSATSEALAKRVSEVADPLQAFRAFVAEARHALERTQLRRKSSGPVCLVHGRSSAVQLHKMISKQGGLSVGTVFTKEGWNLPVRFDRVGNSLVMRVTSAVARRFELPVRDGVEPVRIVDFEFHEVDLSRWNIEPLVIYSTGTSTAADAALSESIFAFAEKCCRAAFGDVDMLVSEAPPLLRPRRPLPLQREKASRTVSRAGSRAGRLPPEKLRRTPLLKVLTGRLRGSVSTALEDAISTVRDCALFDADWYLETYADVAERKLEPTRHYLEFGWLEGRDPSREFSTKLYLKDNPDVAQQAVNPLIHYIEFGQFEGRKIRPRIARERIPSR